MTIDRATVIALSSLLAGLLVTVWLSFGIGTGAINDYERFVRYTARLAFFLFLPVFVLGALTQLTDIRLAKALRPKRRLLGFCLLYTSPSPRDGLLSRMPSSA